MLFNVLHGGQRKETSLQESETCITGSEKNPDEQNMTRRMKE